MGEPEEELPCQRCDPRQVRADRQGRDQEDDADYVRDPAQVAQAQPWIDVYAEFRVIPKSFTAQDLLK